MSDDLSRPRRRRRPARVLLALVAVAGLVAVAAVAALGLGRTARSAGEVVPAAPVTTRITRATLVEAATVEAELGYGRPQPLTSAAAGMVTWLPAVGDTVSRGESLLRADERPIVLLYGPLPLYRRLAKDLEGPDVRQFERNLRALGYRGFTVDEIYSTATEAAVKRWQKALGVPPTGAVDLGAVVYATGAARVAAHTGRVGGEARGQILTYTGTEKTVTASVPAGKAGWARAGMAVTVLLPGGAGVAGTITGVGTEAVAVEGQAPQAGAGDGAEASVDVFVRVREQRRLSAFDRAPVQVRHIVQQRKKVLTVPVNALLALAEGGYGLEVVEQQRSRTVAVKVGLFADGRVEVTGASLAEGMTVVSPT